VKHAAQRYSYGESVTGVLLLGYYA